jgi:molybdopterin synthase sulfur carrier subunit
MARIYIPALLQRFTGGVSMLELDGSTIGEIAGQLDARFPGLAGQLVEGGSLRPNIAVAVNGEVTVEGLRTRIAAGDEVHFVGAIRGGIGQRSYCGR